MMRRAFGPYPPGDVFTRTRSHGAEEVGRWRADGMMHHPQRGPGIEPGDEVPAGGKGVDIPSVKASPAEVVAERLGSSRRPTTGLNPIRGGG